MIKEKSNDFFGVNKGLIIDNSYDLYTLKSFLKYCEDEQIEYLYSQDTDLTYLGQFKDIKYLSIPQEATNFNVIDCLTSLKGLTLYSSSLNKINKNTFNKIQYLEIIFDQKTIVDFSDFAKLKRLRVVSFPFAEMNITSNLEVLELDCCKKITNLDFLKNATKLKKLGLFYLPKLENINCLRMLYKNLEMINVLDCVNIKNIEDVLCDLINLTDIKIITSTTSSKMKLKSLAFADNLSKLKTFATDYKIEDGNLQNLLKLEDANIAVFYKNYNLRDKDLPHIDVIINCDGNFKKVKLRSLELGKKDVRIVWLK